MYEETFDKVYSVTELLESVDNLIRENFSPVTVEGEISDFKITPGGHATFSLKDERGTVKAIMYRGRFIRYQDVLKEGKKVRTIANLTVYKERGELNLDVIHIEEIGLGEAYLKLLELKRKLEREGLFDKKYKRTIPSFPRKIGVVTSLKGAAIHDFLNVLLRRFKNVHVVVYHSKVQGDNAEEEIIEGVRYFNEREYVDVIVITRGGGSKEDLSAFNEEKLVRTVFESKIPVVSAVGHHIDYTLVDLVADLRAETPTAAAEILTKKEEEVIEKLKQLKKHLILLIKDKLASKKSIMLSLSKKLELKNPRTVLTQSSLKLDELKGRLQLAINQRLTNLNHKLQILRSKLDVNKLHQKLNLYKEKVKLLKSSLNNLSPRNILEKGFAICYNEKGKILKDIYSIKEGEKIKVELKNGILICKVIDRRLLI